MGGYIIKMLQHIIWLTLGSHEALTSKYFRMYNNFHYTQNISLCGHRYMKLVVR